MIPLCNIPRPSLLFVKYTHIDLINSKNTTELVRDYMEVEFKVML